MQLSHVFDDMSCGSTKVRGVRRQLDSSANALITHASTLFMVIIVTERARACLGFVMKMHRNLLSAQPQMAIPFTQSLHFGPRIWGICSGSVDHLS